MKSQSVIKQDDAYMNRVVATGCPHSGWEASLPALRQLGLEASGEPFAEWHDELFQSVGITDLLKLNQPLQPDNGMTEKAKALLSDEPGAPLLWPDSRSLWLLDFWASTFPQMRFLLLYKRAENALAYALRHGADPAQFMEAWHAANRQLVRFQCRNRRRSLLLDAEAVAQYPGALADACKRIGLVLRPADPAPILTTSAPALEHLLASQFLREQPAIQALQMELEASAQPLGEIRTHEPPQPVEYYQGYRQWQVRIEQLVKSREEQAEMAIDLQAQLIQVKRTQEKREVANKEVEQENELLQQRLHQVQEEFGTVSQQKQQIEQAQQGQEAQLKQLQQELVGTRSKLQEEETRRKGLADEQPQLLAKIEQLTKGRDEQVQLATERQAQLIQARQVQEKLEVANEDGEQESELLLLQLHQVQEELEAVFLQKQRIEQALKEQEAQLKQLQPELDGTRSKLQTEEKIRKGLADEQLQLLAKIEQLTSERDEQARQATERQAQLSQVREAQEKLEAANKDGEQENELLLLQLHQVQEELEAVFLEKQQIEQVQKEQGTQLKQLQQKLDDSKNKFQAEEKGRKKLAGDQQKLQARIEQLVQARDEQAKLAKSRQSQIQQLTQGRDEQEKLVEAHQSQMQQLTKGRNEQTKLATDRQTQLIQAQQAQEKLEVANKETEQENELLLLQLHQVQEELEHYFLKQQELTQELDEERQVESSDSGQHQEIEKSSPAKPRKRSGPVHALTKPFRRTSKARKREKKNVRQIKESGLFDEAWYLAEYPDVADAGIAPIEHYLRYGAAEERNPSPQFDTAFYLATNPDIDAVVINPLIHYVRFGREEGRPPSSQEIAL